jgi:hypothetical protein
MLEKFLHQNASAIFALVGALGATLLSFVTAWLLKRREHTLRLWDKLLERRIKAHEIVLSVAMEMRVMIALGGIEKDGEAARSPRVMFSKDAFEQWFTSATGRLSEGSTWLTLDVTREVNFLQDYLVTLYQNLAKFPQANYRKVGQLIRSDFINLSSELELKAFQFFEKDLHELKLGNLRDWHKYPRTKTEDRLNRTALLTRWPEIQEVAKSEL